MHPLSNDQVQASLLYHARFFDILWHSGAGILHEEEPRYKRLIRHAAAYLAFSTIAQTQLSFLLRLVSKRMRKQIAKALTEIGEVKSATKASILLLEALEDNQKKDLLLVTICRHANLIQSYAPTHSSEQISRIPYDLTAELFNFIDDDEPT